MKTKWITPVLIGIALLAACTPTIPTETGTVSIPTAEPVAAQETDAAVVSVAPVDTTDPSGLTYVREEEKLARDVYQFLYEQWGVQVFTNIASSEQAHTDIIKSLLDIYGLTDPAADTQPGQFANASLQALYDQLTAQGSLSLDFQRAARKAALLFPFGSISNPRLIAGDLIQPAFTPVTWSIMLNNTRRLGMVEAAALAPLNQPPSFLETFKIPLWMETSFTSVQG